VRERRVSVVLGGLLRHFGDRIDGVERVLDLYRQARNCGGLWRRGRRGDPDDRQALRTRSDPFWPEPRVRQFRNGKPLVDVRWLPMPDSGNPASERNSQ
jgi:hypothetical protein